MSTARYGTFLCNSEKERYSCALQQTTVSWWDEVQRSRHKYVSHLYEASDQVLYPSWSMRHLYFWREYFCRWETGQFRPDRNKDWQQLVAPLLRLPAQLQQLQAENEALKRELEQIKQQRESVNAAPTT
jgi:myotubularin-related protein 1/2